MLVGFSDYRIYLMQQTLLVPEVTITEQYLVIHWVANLIPVGAKILQIQHLTY